MSKQDFKDATKPHEDRSKQPPRFSLHLNWGQRDELEEMAQGMPWATYIKEVVFGPNKRIPFRYTEIDRKLIGRLLAALGKSRVANNLNQLAKAVNTGSLPVNQEVEKAILDACRAVQWMRITLMKAMGMRAEYTEDLKSRWPHEPER